MNDDRSNSTLRGQLAMLRRRRVVIVGVAVVGAAIAFGLSSIQEEQYTASSTIRFKDTSQSLSLVSGLLPSTGEAPAQVAAQGAEAVTRTVVLKKVRVPQAERGSIDDLRSRITAAQQTDSNLIDISVVATSSDDAARLSNEVAQAAVDTANREARDQYSKLAKEFRRQLQNDETLPEDGRRIIAEQAARLQAASTVSQVAEISSNASRPESPSSPKPLRNSIAGGFFGLLVGFGLAKLLETLDKRLREPKEAQELLGVPIVGVIPHDAMGGAPIAGVPAPEHVAAMDAFRMLRTNLAFLDVDSPPGIALVTSALPDEGKTSVAMGVALAAAASGQRTLLIEADLHRPVHASRLGLNAAPGLADYLAGEAKPAEILQVRSFVDPALGMEAARSPAGQKTPEASLVCITAGTRTAWSSEVIGSERFANLLLRVKHAYDLVIVDTAPLLAVAETSQIVPHVDSVAYCVRLGQTTSDQAVAGREALQRLPEKPTGLVLTDVTNEAGDGYGYYSYAYNYRFGAEGGRLSGLLRRKNRTSDSDPEDAFLPTAKPDDRDGPDDRSASSAVASPDGAATNGQPKEQASQPAAESPGTGS